MDQDRGRRPFLRGDLVLVGPAPVVRHRPALEHGRVELGRVLGVGNGRVVDQHDQGLAPNVEPLVVVPAILGGDHAVADEDDVRFLDLDLLGHPPRDGHEIVGKRQPDRATARLERPADLLGLEADQRNVLDERAVGIARLQPHFLELAGQVGDRLLLPRRSRAAALKLVRGQDLDVLQDLLRLDALQRGLQVQGRARPPRPIQPGKQSQRFFGRDVA